jgi:hypothetical protein
VLPSTALYKSVLHTPHRRAAYIDVYDIDGNVRALGVPINDGLVSASLTNRVTRTASFTLSDEWFPRSIDDPFSPYRAVVRIFAGTGYGNGSEEVFPVFTGRVYDVNRDANGSVTFRADDLAADVVAYPFEQPTNSNTGSTILAQIRTLILQALPQAQFGTDTADDATTPKLTWDEDRGKALDDLSEALGSRWYALGDGSFVVRPFPYAVATPVVTLTDGVQGLLSTAQVSITRDGTANSVTVVAERMDGTDPVRYVARDITPTSPTFFGGKFGKVSQIIKIQTPLTTGQAQTLARKQLSAATALTQQWSADVVPDYTLEPGDTVRLSYRGLQADQVVDSITYPLMTSRLMQLRTRSSIPEDVSSGGEIIGID